MLTIIMKQNMTTHKKIHVINVPKNIIHYSYTSLHSLGERVFGICCGKTISFVGTAELLSTSLFIVTAFVLGRLISNLS